MIMCMETKSYLQDLVYITILTSSNAMIINKPTFTQTETCKDFNIWMMLANLTSTLHIES